MKAGDRLGPYAVVELLGAGGMGEVWLADDERLDRKVAIKVLPGELGSDPERLARFEQEARAAAALNHPHIAAVYDVGESDSVRYMVQEYLAGATLRDKLDAGPPPRRKGLAILTEIVEALAAAHQAGIVHRDLKPENVFISQDGHAKVLDFGLAKLLVEPVSDGTISGTPTRMQSPVVTSDGQVVGSAGYMSPEQAQGQPVDHRSDLFSFGCILYEVITGRRCFEGRSVHETLSKIVHEESPRLAEAGIGAAAELDWVLDKCLAKDPDDRYQHASDLAVRLRHLGSRVESDTSGKVVAVAGAKRRSSWLPAAVATGVGGLLLGLALGATFIAGDGATVGSVARPIRFQIELPPGETIALGGQPPNALAIMGDGSEVAYTTIVDGRSQIYRRRLDQLESVAVTGTVGGLGPAYSADGTLLAFFASGRMSVVPLSGGAPVSLTDAAIQRGAAITPAGELIFTETINSGLSRVSVAGGPAEAISTLDVEAGEFSHRWPHVLPDGRHVLFTIDTGGSFDAARIGVLEIGVPGHRVLLEGAMRPIYSPTGHVVFASQGELLAVPFDLDALEVTGRPRRVLAGVATQQDTGAAHFALAADGTLAYVPGGAETNERTIFRVAADGEQQPLSGLPLRAYQQPSMAPDGSRLAVNIVEATHDIWIAELARGTLTRLTFEGDNHAPVWSPDMRRLAYSSERGGPSSLYAITADGSGVDELLVTGDYALLPTSWAADGRSLAYMEVHGQSRSDIWILDVETGERSSFLATEYDEGGAVFSPGGDLLAYTSNETGRAEVYVQAYPGPGAKLKISTDGGAQPAWSRDGNELYYRSGNRMLSVRVARGGQLQAGSPEVLFEKEIADGFVYNPKIYDVGEDGGFVMSIGETAARPDRVNVVVGWAQAALTSSGDER